MQTVRRDSQRVKFGCEGVVAEKEVGSKGKAVSVCGLFVWLVFKMRAPWGWLNADGKGLGERQRVKTEEGERIRDQAFNKYLLN